MPELNTPLPKPIVFVIMPFDDGFTNVAGAIEEVVKELGAEFIRADKDISPQDSDNILLKTHNRIKEANVVIADLTGKNPNVFYEFGFTRAFNKSFLILSQNKNDIPFNVKNARHNFYSKDNMPGLKAEMRERLRLLLEESKVSPFGISVHGADIPERLEGKETTTVEVTGKGKSEFKLQASLNNHSKRILPPNFFAYIYTDTDCPIVPLRFTGTFGFRANVLEPEEKKLPDMDREVLEYRLNIALPALPSGASERFEVFFKLREGYEGTAEPFLVRVCTDTRQFNFLFRLKVLS